MVNRLRTLHNRQEEGASAVEYALLVVAIALIMVVGAFALGGAISDRLDESADCVTEASATNASCDGAAE